MGNRRKSILKTRLGDLTLYPIVIPRLEIASHIVVKRQGQTDIVGRYVSAVLPFYERIDTRR